MAIYPSIAILAANLGEVRLAAIVRPLLASLVFAAITYAIAWAATRSRASASALTAWTLLLVFSYGHIYDALKGVSLGELRPGRHIFLFPTWILLALVGYLAVIRFRPGRIFFVSMTVIAFAAIVQPAARVLIYEARSSASFAEAATTHRSEVSGAALPPLANKPDIYYIILDAYARHDVMSEVYGYDNTEFLADLRELGFVVGACSQSNYNQTGLSLASSLNFEYLDTLDPQKGRGVSDLVWVTSAIRESRLRSYLEGQGYRTIAFETGFPFTEIVDADVFLAPSSSQEHQIRGLSAFEEMFVQTTAFSFLQDGLSLLPNAANAGLTESEKWHRSHVLFTLDSLENLVSLPGPKFVFAHVVAPHGPFTFGPEGEPVHSPDEDTTPPEVLRRAYADQSEFISARVIEALRLVLSISAPPPVIILQADHGPAHSSPEDNLSILSAFLFPGAADVVYNTVTPVNSWRLVLNELAGSELPLLQDVSYFAHDSVSDDSFGFTAIPQQCPE